MLVGLDAGSTAAKIVKFENHRLKGYRIVESHRWKELVKNLRADEIFSTGYFRKNVPHRQAITEITSAIYGVRHYFSDVDVITDIGGQDTKVIDLNTNRFLLNDKCSAGTGAFLELVANYFSIPLEKLGTMHFKAKKIAEINNTCGVFALSEMISQLVKGYKIEEVIAGMHYAFARRISELVPADSENIVLIGGVVKNKGVVTALSDILSKTLKIPKEPQIINAIGAAKYGLEIMKREGGKGR